MLESLDFNRVIGFGEAPWWDFFFKIVVQMPRFVVGFHLQNSGTNAKVYVL